MSIYDWSTTAASNNSAAPNGAPEGMAPSAVNDVIRENMAAIAKWFADTNGTLVSTGSANAYALSINSTDTLYDGQTLVFDANFGNTGAATLNVTNSGGAAQGAVTIKKNNDQDLESGDIETGQKVAVVYDGTNFQMLSQVANVIAAASETVAGKVELATAAETNTGTDATRAVSPDALAGSNYGTAVVPIIVFNDATDCSTGDGAGDVWFRVPSILNGWDLVGVAACCQTAGTTGTMDIQVHNVTQAADMLTTKITIDSGETDSSTAATPAVIDTNNDDVATGDQIRIDVDAVHTTAAKGLLVELQFRLP